MLASQGNSMLIQFTYRKTLMPANDTHTYKQLSRHIYDIVDKPRLLKSPASGFYRVLYFWVFKKAQLKP